MNGREVGYQGNECLKYPELDIDTLGHGIAHCTDYERDCGLRNGFERYEPLKGTKRYGDHFGILRCTTHEDRLQELFGLWAI